MSDCRTGGRAAYEPPEREDDVLRGRIVFSDGTELPLSYYRMGREVDHFEMDGVRYVDEGEAAKLRALVREYSLFVNIVMTFLGWDNMAGDMPDDQYDETSDKAQALLDRARELGIEVE